MKVLVTGAGGFLGKCVVSEFLKRGHAVRALVRPASVVTPTEWRGRVDIVRTDLRAESALEDLFDGVDVLVHLAATVRGTPEAQFVGCVVSTERLLEGMRRAGSARHIVLASSFSVYDATAATGTITEASPVESKPYKCDGYTVAKVWQERVARRLADENHWTLAVLRPGLIYGPGAASDGACVNFRGISMVVAPLSRLRLTHVENCAAAFADSAERRVSGTFNIVDDEQISAWRYAGRINDHSFRIPIPYCAGLAIAYLATLTSRILFPPTGGKLPEILVPRRYRARFRPFKYDTRHAKEVLGWRCRPFFESGCGVI